MPRKPPARLPITPATVRVAWVVLEDTDPLWGHLRWHDAIPMPIENDCLLVPDCHPDDDIESHDCAVTRVQIRRRYRGYRFARQRNGNWMLVREDADV